MLDIAREHGLEGVVAKRLTSTYHIGRRSSSWLKTPLRRATSVVVCGWDLGPRGGLRALILGAHNPAWRPLLRRAFGYRVQRQRPAHSACAVRGDRATDPTIHPAARGRCRLVDAVGQRRLCGRHRVPRVHRPPAPSQLERTARHTRIHSRVARRPLREVVACLRAQSRIPCVCSSAADGGRRRSAAPGVPGLLTTSTTVKVAARNSCGVRRRPVRLSQRAVSCTSAPGTC